MFDVELVGPLLTALFQSDKSPESTRPSSFSVWLVASPAVNSIEAARAFTSSTLSSFDSMTGAAFESPLDATSFPISFESFSYSSRAAFAAARSLSTSLWVVEKSPDVPKPDGLAREVAGDVNALELHPRHSRVADTRTHARRRNDIFAFWVIWKVFVIRLARIRFK